MRTVERRYKYLNICIKFIKITQNVFCRPGSELNSWSRVLSYYNSHLSTSIFQCKIVDNFTNQNNLTKYLWKYTLLYGIPLPTTTLLISLPSLYLRKTNIGSSKKPIILNMLQGSLGCDPNPYNIFFSRK